MGTRMNMRMTMLTAMGITTTDTIIITSMGTSMITRRITITSGKCSPDERP
jgi:hypothetical protein